MAKEPIRAFLICHDDGKLHASCSQEMMTWIQMDPGIVAILIT